MVSEPFLRPSVRGKAATSPLVSDEALQTQGPLLPAVTPLVSFEGMSNITGVLPPDATSDVGPNHIVETVNSTIEVYDKSGTSVSGPSNLSVLWTGVSGPCATSLDGDPVVLYDHLADRWLVSELALPNFPNGPFHECVAVSQTPDPTGSWYAYDFIYSSTLLNDYPKFGVWPDGYYMTSNQIDCSSGSCNVWAGGGVMVFERAAMLAGQPARIIYFDLGPVDLTLGGMLPADLDGPPPPAGTPNPYIQEDDDAWGYSPDQLQIWECHVDWENTANSTFTFDTALTTAAFDTNLCNYNLCIPQPGTSQRLDPLSDRLMNRLQYRNFGGYQSLVVSAAVDVGSDQAGVRWYELRDSGGGWSINQQGTWAPAGNNSWMSSAAMNGAGDIALGYSVSTSTIYPSIRFTGRLSSDTLGQMTVSESQIVAGGGSQSHPAGRWGDYSSMSVDPMDDCTFWYTQEYLPTATYATWHTRIASFKLEDCPAATCATDADCNDGIPCTLDTCDTGAGTCQHAIPSAAPGSVLDLGIDPVPPGSATLSWGGVANAAWYDLFVDGSADLAGLACLQPDLTGLSTIDSSVPPPGGIRYLLLSSENCAGSSELGDGTSAQPRPVPPSCP
ncbi:MAG TPA: hypothetical protein VNI57_12370 [Candidatus Saccharimonadales bacterium]|nr:hypothetical protein [Candidatus Saccharimonadales bacterium]